MRQESLRKNLERNYSLIHFLIVLENKRKLPNEWKAAPVSPRCWCCIAPETLTVLQQWALFHSAVVHLSVVRRMQMFIPCLPLSPPRASLSSSAFSPRSDTVNTHKSLYVLKMWCGFRSVSLWAALLNLTFQHALLLNQQSVLNPHTPLLSGVSSHRISQFSAVY